MLRLRKWLLLSAILYGTSFVGLAQEKLEPATFTFGGFAKSDYMFTQYNYGPYSGVGRDFHVPGTIPVGDNKDVHLYNDFHVKESRLNFEVASKVNSKKIRAFIEMDFMMSPGGDERVSNSYNPRMRHFYLEYNNLLVGQTWSTFMIVTIPDELDFLGAPEGLVFVRQPQARISLGSFQFSIENQISTITPYRGGSSDRFTTKTGLLPDVVGRYNYKQDAGTFSIAVIGRNLQYMEGDTTLHKAFGAGVTMGGTIKVGKKDDLRFVGTFGTGLGRYVGVNFVNAAVVDDAQNLSPITTINGYVAYLHYWTEKLRSNASASYFLAKNNPQLIGESNNRAVSLSGNILFQPVSKLLFGAEAIWGYREIVGGQNGDFYRLQFSAKYAFSFKSKAIQ